MKKRSLWPYAIGTGLLMVFAVNFGFLYLSIKSDDGLEDKDYYTKGLFYEDKIKTERELGWKIDFSMDWGAGAPEAQLIKVSIADANGKPLRDANVRIILRRPASDRFDKTVGLAALSSDEGYVGKINIPLEGYWDLKVVAGKNGKEVEKTFRIKV